MERQCEVPTIALETEEDDIAIKD